MATSLAPENVIIGTANGPGIFIAPEGSAAPTDATTALDAAYTTLGYLSEDGVTFAVSTDSESITPWQSRSPVRTIITGRELTVDFTMLEFNAQNAALYFSQPVPVETDGSFDLDVRSDSSSVTHTVVVDVKDGDVTMRYYFPRATLSEAGDMEITQSGAIGLPVTLSALDNSGVLLKVFKSVPAPGAMASRQGPVSSGTTTSTK